jgi:hypothetical protein
LAEKKKERNLEYIHDNAAAPTSLNTAPNTHRKLLNTTVGFYECSLKSDEQLLQFCLFFGQRVLSWIANMTKKAADGSWAIGLEAAGHLLAQAISQYYGLPK